MSSGVTGTREEGEEEQEDEEEDTTKARLRRALAGIERDAELQMLVVCVMDCFRCI